MIKEPIAFSTLKQRWSNRDYASFGEFVRECALIWHNAHTYNRPNAGAYVDATTIKGLMEAELENLVKRKVITSEVAAWPDLGEIPPVEDLPDEDDDEDEEEDEEEDDDEEVEDSEEEGKKKRKRGRPSLKKGESKDESLKGDPISKKKRGRPPKVDTPMEARIKNVLKAIRKPKSNQGQVMIHHFEKLPDKQAMPEYYTEIREPIAIDSIKVIVVFPSMPATSNCDQRKQKRKKYQSVDHFMKDIDTMFNNAKAYNEDDSQIYKDAQQLQAEAHRVAEAEKQKSDSEFVMDEGRIPLPNGIVHNNQLWQVGDWIHLQNANDVTKPIVAQIYRTWQDADGQKWVNACWYYRPEQTVHQYEKHFFPNEVVKTGQYRDHHIDEIVDRCFVMFFTRFSKGRPRGLATDTEVYVCEARYNEEKKRLNKIKTWASCLPDEVRDKDYEMDVWDTQKKVKKIPSPLLPMLKEETSENDELPEPTWGAENAPPIIGGIYRGPRDENVRPHKISKINCLQWLTHDSNHHHQRKLHLHLLLQFLHLHGKLRIRRLTIRLGVAGRTRRTENEAAHTLLLQQCLHCRGPSLQSKRPFRNNTTPPNPLQHQDTTHRMDLLTQLTLHNLRTVGRCPFLHQQHKTRMAHPADTPINLFLTVVIQLPSPH